jgi:dienelactone hydrolase
METLDLAGAPAIAAYADTPRAAAERGTVLVYHAVGGDKSVHADDLERLASAGFLAIGVDAVGHGDRAWADAWERLRAGWQRAMLEVVTETAAEVPALLDELEERGWAAPGRVGVAGISLGGFVAYGAAIAERRIAAAVAIAASPRWGPDPRSPHRHPARFPPLALLSITGGGDTWVPPSEARSLHETLAPLYAATPERLRYLELAGEPHWMSAPAWIHARGEAERWFDRFLRGQGHLPARPPATRA